MLTSKHELARLYSLCTNKNMSLRIHSVFSNSRFKPSNHTLSPPPPPPTSSKLSPLLLYSPPILHQAPISSPVSAQNPEMNRHDHQSRSFISASRKTRKRGCSSSTSSCTSSLVHGYRFKKAVLVSTPMLKRSPRYGGVGDEGVERPVSARKLAATLWGLNEEVDEVRSKESRRRRSGGGGTCSSFPLHLSDPSHSPNSERMGGSRPGSVRRTFAHSVRRNAAVENETRSRRETPRGSSVGVRDRLKDVRNVIMTSKELLKIVDHVWVREEQNSSSISLVSALHQELEKARVQVERLIQDQGSSGQMDVSRLIKQFAAEKAACKVKEREVVETAIQSIAGELEGERKLRRRFESLNKKLGAELQSMKGSLQKVTDELESEKRTRKILEQVCDELAGNRGEDKAQLEQLKLESENALQEVEKEREMLRLADLLREERVQMKLSEAKNQFEEKNATVDKLKRELETILKPHKTKGKGGGSSQCRLDRGNSAEIAQFLNSIRFGTADDEMEESVGQVEDYADNEFQSNRSYKMTNWTANESQKYPMDDDGFEHRSISGSRRRSSRSSSVHKNMLKEESHNYERRLDRDLLSGYQKKRQEYDFGDSMHFHKYPSMSRHSKYSNHPKDSLIRFVSPVRQWGQVRPPRDPHHAVSEMHTQAYSTASKSRLSDARSETKSRKSYR